MPRSLRKTKLTDEIFSGNGKTYVYDCTLGNVDMFRQECGCDVGQFSFDLVEDKLPIDLMRGLLAHTLAEVDGSTNFDAEQEVEMFMEDFGLKDSARACLLIINTSLAGKVKKKIQVAQLARRRRLVLTLNHLKKYGLWWAVALTAGTGTTWWNWSYFMMFIASAME